MKGFHMKESGGKRAPSKLKQIRPSEIFMMHNPNTFN